MSTQWYAVCTRPQHELKVAAALLKKGIETLCPQTRKMLVSNGFRKKISYSPVFPSFVFVHITEAEMSTVLRTNDVTNFMYWMGRPAVVSETDINAMQQFASRYPNVTLKRTAVVKNALAGNNEQQVYTTKAGQSDEIIQQVLPSIGFILTASREKNYRIVNNNIERGKMIS